MVKKIQGIQAEQPFEFSAKDVIREPKIGIITEAYPVGEREYRILTEQHWVHWLSPIAFASLGVFVKELYNLIALAFQEFNGNVKREMLINEISKSKLIVIVSLAMFIILFLVNKCVPTEKKKLLKNIRTTLDSNSSVIASKRKGKACD